MKNLREILAKEKIAEIDEDLYFRSINDLSLATQEEVSFANYKSRQALQSTNALAVFVEEDLQGFVPLETRAIIVKNPYLAIAKLSKYVQKPLVRKGADPIVDRSTKNFASFVGKDTTIGKNCLIMPSVYVGNNVKIGNNVTIHPNVTIYDDTIISDDVVIHAGVVIGSDGFGYAQDEEFMHFKLHHISYVHIERGVEIGANTTIDRGLFKPTIIGEFSKLDNLIQIGHNCEVGKRCVVVAQSGLAGSSIIGKNVMIGAQSGTAGHLKIGDGAMLAARSGVTQTIEGNKVYAGFPLLEKGKWLRLQAKLLRFANEKKHQ